MYVKVTAAGDGLKFLDRDKKAFPVKAGETVVVMNEAYGQSLIDSGFAEAITPPIAAPSLPEPPADEPKPEAAIVAELVEINGIGEATAKKLAAAGIQSIAGLINADPIELAKAVDVTESKVTSWQAAANQLLEDE